MTIKELNTQQLIAALGFYNSAPAIDRKLLSFRDFLANCTLESIGGEGAGILWHPNDKTSVYIEHGFYSLYESEEKEITEHLAELLNQ